MKIGKSRGKHVNEKKRNKIVDAFVVLIITIIIFAIFLVVYSKIRTSNNQEENLNINVSEEENNEINNENIINEPVISDMEMPEKIGNFNVIGQITFEKLNNLQIYILNKTTKESLDLAVTRFYGPAYPNKVGNLCISGHNTSEKFFKNLKDLNLGDTFYIIDSEKHEKVIYKIYKKYSVEPKDLDCLNQGTNNKREVTLITCDPRCSNEAYN